MKMYFSYFVLLLTFQAQAQTTKFSDTIATQYEHIILLSEVHQDSLYLYMDYTSDKKQEHLRFQFYDVYQQKSLTPTFGIQICSNPLNLDGACYLDSNEAFVLKIDDFYGKMTMKGQVITPFEYEQIEYFESDSLDILKKKGEWSVKRKGVEHILDVDNYFGQVEGHYIFKQKNKLVFLNQELTLDKKLPLQKNALVMEKSEELVLLHNNCLYGLGKIDGTIVVEPTYTYLAIGNEYVVAWMDHFCGMMTLEGELVTKVAFDEIAFYPVNGITVAVKDGFSVLINGSGEQLPGKRKYTRIYLHEQFSQVQAEDGKWGFINEQGEEVIIPEYEDLCYFKNGLACAEKNGKYGFINEQGEVVIDFQFDGGASMYFYQADEAKVRMGDDCFLIDRKGEIISKTPCKR